MFNSETAFLIVFGGLCLTALTIVLLWHILHFILCRKFDAILFRQPYFRITELAVYSSWPLSLFRSMGYILLLGVPSIAKNRRFKGVELNTSGQFALVLACRVFLISVIFGVLFLLVTIIWGFTVRYTQGS